MAQSLIGKVSWFGGPHDPSAGPTMAFQGKPVSAGGIAVFNQETLGGFWEVTFENGRSVVLQQNDIGPAPSTGRVLDVNYASLPTAGYTESNFPTDSTIHAHYLGRGPGVAARAAAPASVGIAAPAAGSREGILAPVAAVVGSSSLFVISLVLAAGVGLWLLFTREARVAAGRGTDAAGVRV